MTIKITADFMENEAGDLMLVIPTADGEPVNPKLTLNKEASSATLNRAAGQDFSIDNIHPDIREKLKSTKKILVTEVADGGIVGGYVVARRCSVLVSSAAHAIAACTQRLHRLHACPQSCGMQPGLKCGGQPAKWLSSITSPPASQPMSPACRRAQKAW